MNNHNDHVFSKEYNEKKEAMMRSIRKNEKQEKQFSRKFPIKVVLAAGLMTVILTTSIFAATGMIIPTKKYTTLRTDYIPEGYSEIVSIYEDYKDGVATLCYYVASLEGEKFMSIVDMDDLPDKLEYETFEVNGHFAQILVNNHWAPEPEEGIDEYTHKILYVCFEEEDLVVHISASNKISVEELKKVAEGLSLEETEDKNLAVKIHYSKK